MQNAVLNVNGEIFKYPENRVPRISVFDRGYLYGDSIYEVVRTYGGKAFGVEEHLERMVQSARLMRMPLSQTVADYRRQIDRTLEAFLKAQSGMEAYIRIIVSRGAGRIGFGVSCVETPTLYSIIVQPLELPSDALLKRGMHFKIATRLRNDRRAQDPAAKTGNYINSVLAYLETQPTQKITKDSDRVDDALLCNADGHLTEGTTFNLFYVKRRIVVTPPVDIGILEGITRKHVLRIARESGLEARETRFPPERLFEADEVFMSSSIKEIFPVTRIDGRPIGRGKNAGHPGAVTLSLRQKFSAWAHDQAGKTLR